MKFTESTFELNLLPRPPSIMESPGRPPAKRTRGCLWAPSSRQLGPAPAAQSVFSPSRPDTILMATDIHHRGIPPLMPDQPVKKQSKWSPEEDTLIIELRGGGMKWEEISKRLPGRSAISCRLHSQNYLERQSDWDEERKNQLARLYERFKSEMWAKAAEEQAIPWRAAEAMHWQLSEAEIARRAGVGPVPKINMKSPARVPEKSPPRRFLFSSSLDSCVEKTTIDNRVESVSPPPTRPISQEKLVSEVKGIYAGLVMVDSKCIEIEDANTRKKSRLSQDQWQALITLLRTFLHEHHDFFLAIQHPSVSPILRKPATQYAMPAQMRRHTLHPFRRLLNQEPPDTLYDMLSFVYLTYSMPALLYQTLPCFSDAWTKCLECHRVAIEDEDERDRIQWTNVAKYWYRATLNKQPGKGRLHHHLAILARRDPILELFYYFKALLGPAPTLRDFFVRISPRLFNALYQQPGSSSLHHHLAILAPRQDSILQLFDCFEASSHHLTTPLDPLTRISPRLLDAIHQHLRSCATFIPTLGSFFLAKARLAELDADFTQVRDIFSQARMLWSKYLGTSNRTKMLMSTTRRQEYWSHDKHKSTTDKERTRLYLPYVSLRTITRFLAEKITSTTCNPSASSLPISIQSNIIVSKA